MLRRFGPQQVVIFSLCCFVDAFDQNQPVYSTIRVGLRPSGLAKTDCLSYFVLTQGLGLLCRIEELRICSSYPYRDSEVDLK